jgi:hypothetical protein
MNTEVVGIIALLLVLLHGACISRDHHPEWLLDLDDRGTWRFACVVMIDVVEMLVIADVAPFRVFVFRIHPFRNHTKSHHPECPTHHDHTT